MLSSLLSGNKVCSEVLATFRVQDPPPGLISSPSVAPRQWLSL